MNAMILAAGRGERLRPVTDEVPKAMVQVRGERLIDRHLAMLARAGVRKVVINLGWLGERIAEHVAAGNCFGVQVVYSPEYERVLETGGGIYRALPMLGKAPFWVINGDIYSDFQLPADSLDDALDGELVLVPTPKHKAKSDFALSDGLVRNDGDVSLTFAGIARYRATFFDHAPGGRFSLVPLMRAAADAGRLGGRIYSGSWEDIGTPERLEHLNRR